MAGHFFYSILIIWKRVCTSFSFIKRQSDSKRKSRQTTLKELRREKKEINREFMYLNKNVDSTAGDGKNQAAKNAIDCTKKYHLLSPH